MEILRKNITFFFVGFTAIGVLTLIFFIGFGEKDGMSVLSSESVIPGAEHIVTLTDSGFSPRTITIRRSDVIIFTTTRSKPFWPASNLHPTHEIYPEFDARQPISPDKSWSFKFTKVGMWGFHDHLRAHFTGVVNVVE